MKYFKTKQNQLTVNVSLQASIFPILAKIKYKILHNSFHRCSSISTIFGYISLNSVFQLAQVQ